MQTLTQHKISPSKKSTPFFSPTFVQPKLTIDKPNDKYEQEADKMADEVVKNTANPDIQTKCAQCGEDENIQTKTKGVFFQVPSMIQKQENSIKRENQKSSNSFLIDSLLPFGFQNNFSSKKPRQSIFPNCPQKNTSNNHAFPNKALSDQPSTFQAIFEESKIQYSDLSSAKIRVLLEVYDKMTDFGLENLIQSIVKIDAHGTGKVVFVSNNQNGLLEKFLLFQICKLNCLDDINLLHPGQKCFREINPINSLHLCISNGNTFDAHIDKVPPAKALDKRGNCINDFNAAAIHIFNEATPEIIKSVFIKYVPVLGTLVDSPKIDIFKFLPRRDPPFDKFIGHSKAFDFSSDSNLENKKVDIVDILDAQIGKNWRFQLTYSYFEDSFNK